MHHLMEFVFALDPELIKCPGSNAHVWNLDQCNSFDFGGRPGGTTSSGGGGRGFLGGLLGTLTGGLL